jgi:hypothetical protein
MKGVLLLCFVVILASSFFCEKFCQNVKSILKLQQAQRFLLKFFEKIFQKSRGFGLGSSDLKGLLL